MIDYFLDKHVPVIGYLELTLRCNHRCVHCYAHPDASSSPDRELDSMEIERVLQGLRNLGCLILVLTGGEVFLRGDALDVMRRARKHGFALVIFSNGSMITETTAEQLFELAPLGVEISLHGARPEVHDGVTGIRGSFERALRAVQHLRDRGVRAKLKYNVLQANGGDHQALIALADRLGVEYRIDPYIYPNRNGGMHPTKQRVTDDTRLQGLFGDSRVVRVPDCANKSYLEVGENRLCGVGSNLVCVSGNGDVYPCVPLRIKAGNVRETSIETIWKQSEVFSRLRSLRNRDLAECQKCSLVGHCSRCSAMAYNETGNLLGCAPLSRRFAEVKRDLAGLHSPAQDERELEAVLLPAGQGVMDD